MRRWIISARKFGSTISWKTYSVSIVVLVVIIIFSATKIARELVMQKRIQIAVAESHLIFEDARGILEELFTEPERAFHSVSESSAIDMFRVSYTSPFWDSWQEDIAVALLHAKGISTVIRDIYFVTPDGTILTTDGIFSGDETNIKYIAGRAFVLREGEYAISRFRKEQNESGATDAVVYYSMPIECKKCFGDPRVAAIVVSVSRVALFSRIASASSEYPDDFFIISAEGQYLYSKKWKNAADADRAFFEGTPSFLDDYPYDSSNIIELRGAVYFNSFNGKYNYFVAPLRPGFDGMRNGEYYRLSARYIPAQHIFWVMGYSSVFNK